MGKCELCCREVYTYIHGYGYCLSHLPVKRICQRVGCQNVTSNPGGVCTTCVISNYSRRD